MLADPHISTVPCSTVDYTEERLGIFEMCITCLINDESDGKNDAMLVLKFDLNSNEP